MSGGKRGHVDEKAFLAQFTAMLKENVKAANAAPAAGSAGDGQGKRGKGRGKTDGSSASEDVGAKKVNRKRSLWFTMKEHSFTPPSAEQHTAAGKVVAPPNWKQLRQDERKRCRGDENEGEQPEEGTETVDDSTAVVTRADRFAVPVGTQCLLRLTQGGCNKTGVRSKSGNWKRQKRRARKTKSSCIVTHNSGERIASQIGQIIRKEFSNCKWRRKAEKASGSKAGSSAGGAQGKKKNKK